MLPVIFSTSVAERSKDRHRRFVLLHHPFRMPLNTERECRRVLDDERFDQTVVGCGFDFEPVGEAIDGLRMQRIDDDSLFAGHSFQQATCNERHFVGGPVLSLDGRVGILFVDLVSGYFVDQLMQAAAELDIHLLKAATDAEQW